MAVTQLNGAQVKDASIGIADLSATGTPSASTYHRGDNTWSTVTAVAPDIALSFRTPTTDETITAEYSAVLVKRYTIGTGLRLIINTNSYFAII